jgi:hypothetical protein
MKDTVKDALKRIDFGKDWWGKVELTVRDGKVTLAEEKQTIKLD